MARTWDTCKTSLEDVRTRGRANGSAKKLLLINRHGVDELLGQARLMLPLINLPSDKPQTAD